MTETRSYQHAMAPIRTAFGSMELHVFSWGVHEEENILAVRSLNFEQDPFVRVQSACYTAEIFRSLDCDCHEQLLVGLDYVANRGGLLIYILCDGRGAGLLAKVRGLALGHEHGLDTADAYERLGIPWDQRDYSRVAQVLRHFGVFRLRLLTNNPRKVAALERHGFSVERVSIEIPSTDTSRSYLATKARKRGHLLGEFTPIPPDRMNRRE